MGQPVSLCMIVRDEEENLGPCLDSVAGLVDEMVILDTGSMDRTRDIARKFGAKVIEIPWASDFAAARNWCREHARGEWIFWLDADDRVDAANRERLSHLFGSLTESHVKRDAAFIMSCCSNGSDGIATSTTHIRLFPNRSRLAWHGRAHERLTFPDGTPPHQLEPTNIAIRHLGYEDAMKVARKQDRDLNLLQLDYAVDPNPLTLFYLGRAYLGKGRLHLALSFLLRSVRGDTSDSSHWRRKAFFFISTCQALLGRSADALRNCEEGLARYPDDLELLCQRGSLLYSAGRLAEAEKCLLYLIELPPPTYILWQVNPELQVEKSRFLLAHIYLAMNRTDDALAQVRRALEQRPDNTEALFLSGQLLLVKGQYTAAESAIHPLEQIEGAAWMALLLRAQTAILTGRFQDARSFVQAAMSGPHQPLVAHIVLSDLLFREARDWDQCIAVHQKILALSPGHPATQRRLEQILASRRRPPLVPALAGAPNGNFTAGQIRFGSGMAFQSSGLLHG